MKRLLCFISCMNAGGAETFLMKIYRTLDKTEYQMDFCINVRDKNFYEDEINSLGGKIYRIPSKSENFSEYKRQLSDVVSENRYTYVLRVTSNAAGFMDLMIAKRAGAKVCIARSSNASDGGGIKTLIAHRLGKQLYGRYVDVKIAPSDLAAIYTFGKRAYKKGKVHLLHNALDLDVYRFNEDDRECVRKEFGIADDVKVIGHVGRLTSQKNHRFLLEVFAHIHKKNPRTVLLLVGKGELEAQIREQADCLGITDYVIFAGIRSDIPRVLSAMDVFIFPSLYEGMPNTVIEAQATGLPCVIADTITKEADVTGLVEYVPLDMPVEKWADIAISASNLPRRETKNDLIRNGYDIQRVVKEFERIIFKD